MAPGVKLTDKDVRWIRACVRQDRRERIAAGWQRGTNGLLRRLAEKFGVPIWTIDAIIRGRRRKSVVQWSNDTIINTKRKKR